MEKQLLYIKSVHSLLVCSLTLQTQLGSYLSAVWTCRSNVPWQPEQDNFMHILSKKLTSVKSKWDLESKEIDRSHIFFFLCLTIIDHNRQSLKCWLGKKVKLLLITVSQHIYLMDYMLVLWFSWWSLHFLPLGRGQFGALLMAPEKWKCKWTKNTLLGISNRFSFLWWCTNYFCYFYLYFFPSLIKEH